MNLEKEQFNVCMKHLETLNFELLHPDVMAWGQFSEEEADDIYNDDARNEEWGNKSFGLLYWISALPDYEDWE
tara:strand:+ start:675 stop:893 length:219 start_codon:yes stop_codon:yes gene_type:complete